MLLFKTIKKLYSRLFNFLLGNKKSASSKLISHLVIIILLIFIVSMLFGIIFRFIIGNELITTNVIYSFLLGLVFIVIWPLIGRLIVCISGE